MGHVANTLWPYCEKFGKILAPLYNSCNNKIPQFSNVPDILVMKASISPNLSDLTFQDRTFNRSDSIGAVSTASGIDCSDEFFQSPSLAVTIRAICSHARIHSHSGCAPVLQRVYVCDSLVDERRSK